MSLIKDCLIVAAGKGTRLKGFGDLKPLVNLCGMPLIEHAMHAAADAGVNRFVVVTGYKAATLSAHLVSLRAKHGWTIDIVENKEFEKDNGLSVLAAEKLLSSEFFLAMCDHVVEPAIYDALRAADLPKGSVGLGVDIRLDNPDVDLDDVTRVNMVDGKIYEIGKEVEQFNAYDAGIFRANPALFKAIHTSIENKGDCTLSGGMKVLSDTGLAFGINIGNARWIDVDSPDMHVRAHAWKHNIMGPGQSKNTPRRIVAVGHRGTKKFAAENTISAHEVAYKLGARAIEFDIRCTKDGHFVVIHDANVKRTTNGHGLVKNMTLAEIKALKVHSPGPGHETIPSLREALRNVKGRFVVDLDFKNGPANSADILEKVLEEEGFLSGHLVTIFARRHQFKKLQNLCPQYALRPHYISVKKTGELAVQHPLEIMGLRRLSFSQKAANAITESDMHLFCNVMGRSDNETGFEDAINAGALFIQTDNLDKLVPYLRERNLLETRVLGRNYKPITS